MAATRLSREQDSSLSTGDLINDAVLRLVQMECISLADKSHFIALASRMMRHILVDHARARGSSKGRQQKVELNTNIDGGHHRIDLNIQLEEIGRAPARTTITNAHLECGLRL